MLAGDRAKLAGMELAEQLRDEVSALKIVCNPGDGSFKSQFKRADRSGAQLAIVLGEDEVSNAVATIKHLRSDQAQEQVKLSAMVDWIHTWLNRSEAI